MNIDKFLTDLAQCTGCDNVRINWRGYFINREKRFEVSLSKLEPSATHGWETVYGEGPTVDTAMADARAQFKARFPEDAT